MDSVDKLRDKCRTCRYLSLNEDNWTSGYCWQCDKPVNFNTYYDFPNEHDPKCQDIIRDGGESVWEPLTILRPYFDRKVLENE